MTAVYTPKMLAERWHCSERHIRRLIQENKLRSFKAGGKLYRIAADAVEEFERRNAASDGSGCGPPRPSATPADAVADTASRLETMTRLNVVRRELQRLRSD